jgi:branched-chain amino acid transport system substrate-binding protein
VRTGKWDAKKAWYTDGLAVAGGAAELKKQNIPVAAIDGSNGTRPAADSKTAGAKTFAELYAASKASPTGEPPTFAAQNFDAHVLCGLAAIAAGSKDGTAIKDKLKAVSGPPGTKYGPGQLAQAIKDLRADKDIDYDGASGPIDFDDAGDPTAGSYDIYTYKGADLKVTDTVQIGG